MNPRLIALCVTLLMGVADGAAAGPRFVGSLACTINGGQGFKFGRTRHLSCVFEPFSGGGLQAYQGTITRFGQNLAAAESKVIMVWSVLSTKPDNGRPLISGKFTGLAGDSGVEPLTGVAGLIGGINNQYILRPVRDQANANVNFAVAIGEIELRALRPQA